jgi:hypothetical protein
VAVEVCCLHMIWSLLSWEYSPKRLFDSVEYISCCAGSPALPLATGFLKEWISSKSKVYKRWSVLSRLSLVRINSPSFPLIKSILIKWVVPLKCQSSIGKYHDYLLIALKVCCQYLSLYVLLFDILFVFFVSLTFGFWICPVVFVNYINSDSWYGFISLLCRFSSMFGA